MVARTSREVQVWDPFVRVAHWTISAAFFVAYMTEDDALTVHVWAGYVVGGVVILRVLWGFVGPRHARFSDFVTGPVTALRYLWDLILGQAKRYAGHSPAGGAMVIALLACLAATVATGLVRYAEERSAGPLAPFYAQTALVGVPQSTEREAGEDEGRRRRSAIGEVHEVLANVTLALVIFHVLGVFLASFVHHENLVRSMVTGSKAAD
jgi:cytochrome b